MKKILLSCLLAVALVNFTNAQGTAPAKSTTGIPARIVVAKSGSRNFSTVQEALDAVPAGNSKPVTIYIRKGVYKEALVVDARKSFISLIGEDKDSTILTYDNHAGTRLPNGDTLNTWTCASTVVYANDFHAANLTFSNTAGFTAGQAVGLRIEGNRASIINCKIIGHQDILFLSGSGVKHYFRDCYIEGTTDFIFGAATAVFINCHIHSKKNSHVTAASTNSIIPYGFVFFNCRLTADSSVNKVSLGRPWSPTASVTYINCWMDKHIVPEGWNNWKNPANELTARYAEYKSTGPGANIAERAKWSKQLTDEEVKKYTLKNIFGEWIPEPTYTNPILHFDFSDPDAIRVGNHYFMTASSFNHVPGLPILQSTDLVNWSIISYALPELTPLDRYSKVQHGCGVWAPSIRFHNGEFYIYYPDPDLGIYLIKAKNIKGPWSKPILVQEGKGLIDPCPLWDDNGKVYLVHAFANSRAGVKSILVVKELSVNGEKVISGQTLVYDGHVSDPTIEGPKFYKRNGYYYIFAPAGGVSRGWQVVLRSKNIYGPYERKVVLDQGNSNVNGPHQGAWVTTPTNEDWFLHFQDKEAYGRIVHLQPMHWINDWPVIGIDTDGDGKGEPVINYPIRSATSKDSIVSSDEFNSTKLGLQWQWQANPKQYWYSLTGNGTLRMYAVYQPDSISLFNAVNILGQKIPAEKFTATIKLTEHFNSIGEKAGIVLLGTDFATVSLAKTEAGLILQTSKSVQANKGGIEKIDQSISLPNGNIFLKVNVDTGAIASFSYSTDGINFLSIGDKFSMKPGVWVGTKFGLYILSSIQNSKPGYVEFDWIRFEK